MVKGISIFVAGLILGALVLTVAALGYKKQLEEKNTNLQSRISTLELLLADADKENPEFVAVPDQEQRESLDFSGVTESISSAGVEGSASLATGVDERFLTLLDDASYSNEAIAEQVNNNVSPAMAAVRQKALSGDFTGFFRLLEEARIEIRNAQQLVDKAESASNDLQVYARQIDTLPNDILDSVESITIASSAYYETLRTLFVKLNETLDGNVPTQALLDEVANLTERVNTQAEDISTQYTQLIELLVMG